MKRFFNIFAIVLLMMLLMSGTAFAAEGDVAPEGEVIDESTGNLPDNTMDDTAAPEFIDRLKEYIDSGKLYELLGLVASGVMLVVAYLLKKGLSSLGGKMVTLIKSGNDQMNASAEEIKNASGDNSTALKDFCEALSDKLAEGTKANEVALDAFMERLIGNIEALRTEFKVQTVTHEQVEKLDAEVKAIAEMLELVYQGSKTIPTVVKERVAVIYNHIVGIPANAGESEASSDEQ